MGFAINPSLNHIDIPEKYILEIHQSSSEIVLPDARFRGHPCEAYICISKIDNEVKAYVALLNNALKNTLVYTSDLVATTKEDYPKVLGDAEDFVKSMGFKMQKVNLEFSPAMREVIVKGLRIMRPPPAPLKRPPVRNVKIEVPEELVVSTGLNETGANEDASSLTEVLSLKAEIASLRGALERAARDRVTAEQQRSSESAALKASCEQALVSRKQAEEKLSRAVQEIRKLQQARPSVTDSSELEQLRNQLEKSIASTAEMDAAKSGLETKLKSVQQELLQLTADRDRLETLLADETVKRTALEAEAANAREKFEERLAAAIAKSEEAAQKIAASTGIEDTLRETLQREQELAENLARAESDLENARAEMEEILASRSLVEETREKLVATEAELTATVEQLSLAQEENLRLTAEAGLAEELRQRLAAMESELAGTRKEMELLAEAGKIGPELEHKLAETAAELDDARKQLAEAAGEIERLQPNEHLVDELRQRLTETEAELAAAKSAIERMEIPEAIVEPEEQPEDEQLSRLTDEKEAVEKEYVRLATESRETEARLSEELATARAELERLGSELEIQSQVAAMEQSALRAELRRIIVEGGASFQTVIAEPALQQTAAQPVYVTVQAPQQVAVSPQPAATAQQWAEAPFENGLEEIVDDETETDDSPDAPIQRNTAILQEFVTDFGGFYSGAGVSSTEFRIDQSMDRIGYNDPAEIMAVFYSSNSVQAVPEGKGIQKCKGYIVAMNNGDEYSVYVAWYLTESGRILVCTPEQQPADSEECVQILKDAISYFEIVGFMMEIAELGDTRKSYLKALKRIPALKRITK